MKIMKLAIVTFPEIFISFIIILLIYTLAVYLMIKNKKGILTYFAVIIFPIIGALCVIFENFLNPKLK